MSKVSKLLKDPKAFFSDALDKRFPGIRLKRELREAHDSPLDTAALIGFSNWKTWMRDVLPNRHVAFIGHSPRVRDILINAIPSFKNPTVYTWSYKYPESVDALIQEKGYTLTFVEDGFIRSVGLGANKSRPMSLVFDSKAMHFDRYRVSDLDDILNTHTFSDEELEMADKVMAMLKSGLTKYISLDSGDSIKEHFKLDPDRRTILVMGQVEDDMSIKYGMETFMSGNDLVARVALENPDAQILYRPHPESLAFNKKHYSNPRDVEHLCHLIKGDWSLHDSLQAADEVHTMTSLTGLEAAIAGLDVHTYGMPFYAGWGFTTDNGLADTHGKRTKNLSLREVVAGAYVKYARYYHPVTSQEISVGQALDIAETLRGHMTRIADNKAAIKAAEEAEAKLTP